MTKHRKEKDELIFLREIVDAIPALVYIKEIADNKEDSECRTLWMNQYGCDLLGYSLEEIRAMEGSFYSQLCHPEEVEHFNHKVEMKQGAAKIESVVTIRRLRPKESNDYFYTYEHGRVMKTTPDGKPLQTVVVAQVLSSLMLSQTQLSRVLKTIRQLRHHPLISTLTNRETEILGMIMRGKTDEQIANLLCISKDTSKKHRSNILRKTNARNTAELVAIASEYGF
ncbi:MAG: LuxR C-terminal-related transcriptional regulator [Bacteroidota bacterium]|nr:LuxR C-terminal-related transcriptional regulator [Bacteroidota bacterium]